MSVARRPAEPRRRRRRSPNPAAGRMDAALSRGAGTVGAAHQLGFRHLGGGLMHPRLPHDSQASPIFQCQGRLKLRGAQLILMHKMLRNYENRCARISRQK